ncbi:hypothetical protein ULMS_23140 [Patiriisocius marinistellae]|uniref:Glycosyltransferase 2-like domain-containing protein n=1 Tax=Patiriisocius marinistellae TaxID=2494560 RepID=A0A5J4G2A7_9FLAO|nr:glycosyltransferase family A protein [Patiriisocius marinistellae]GEQ86806.1 hypothetical protein ULMS_23140 [Patiriisocius marinistellae]
MRVGSNPTKVDKELVISSYHRVVVPVYIPNTEEDYFKEALPILKYSLQSLLKTIHKNTRISIINNGCCTLVTEYLKKIKFENEAIDQLLESDINLGKINAIYSAVKSNIEPLITVTDADVLFLNNWQEAVEQVFVDFPKAGMVAPVPAPVAYKSSYVNSTFYYGFFNRLFKFDTVVNPNALKQFQESIGTHLFKNIHFKSYLVLQKKKKKAAMGCGHFVVTMRSQVFEKAPSRPTKFKIGGESLKRYIDEPNDKAGYLRLATMDCYARHLGNKEEAWMKPMFDALTTSDNFGNEAAINFNSKGISKFSQFIGKVLYRVIIRNNSLRRIYFRSKGMKNSEF